MKLLITTQSVDRDDPILGFFHGWLFEFAKHFEQIHVICLREGKHTLPENVHVHSLGKEKNVNYVRYLWRLFSYVWKLRNEYDVVFSHMNPHYIVLVGWFWLLKGKRMYFWRNHAEMNLKTKIAAWFSARVFYTSPFACTRVFPHAVQMPVGIDTNIFCEQEGIERKEHSVLLLGRLSMVKRPEIFMEASVLLPDYHFISYGDDSAVNQSYQKKLEMLSKGRVTFHPAVPNYETPQIYSSYDVYVNLTPEGSMDKTVLEAAACGTLVVVANQSFKGFIPDDSLLSEATPTALSERIRLLSDMSAEKKNDYQIQMRNMVIQKHSLQKLTNELIKYFSLS